MNDPARTFEEAAMRAQALIALDDERILPQARTMLLTHGRRTALAVVLLHGLTNNPAQYAAFAPMLFEAGANVLVPRLPEHGDRDRMTGRSANLTAQALLRSATEAIDLACGLGERVAVLGISLGGVLAAHAAQFRDDVHLAVPVCPTFALLHLPRWFSRVLVGALRALPNVFLWWNPRAKAMQRPGHAYPRFSTHALAQTMRIADAVYDAARSEAPRAERIVTVVSGGDPAVNNRATAELVAAWRRRRGDAIGYEVLHDLPNNHDVIDPEHPLARTALVYPRLFAALGVELPAALPEKEPQRA